MKTKQIKILEKLTKGELSIEEADKLLLDLECIKGRTTGVKDSKGNIIRFGDTVRFADKWEWYKSEWRWNFAFAKPEEKAKVQAEFDALPYEERVVTSKEDFQWLLSQEIQSYWEIIKTS
ncbi:MAG: hypothetical protein AAF378_18175 [Cyanobacteria bacterium P01_A01_bin.84]